MATPEEMEATMVQNLADKTGKTLAQWLQLVAASGQAKHGEIVKHLKAEHGVTHGYANLIAHRALAAAGPAPAGGDDLVAAQYAGIKAALRPVYDALMKAIGAFGSDVEVAPKKAYVSLRRSKQFAIIQPSTATRVDVGINLKGTAPTGRLEESGGFNAMVSHRVRVSAVEDVDAELVGWLRKAYESS
jgi:predicted transport protein